eukprot:gene7944-biopygen21103
MCFVANPPKSHANVWAPDLFKGQGAQRSSKAALAEHTDKDVAVSWEAGLGTRPRIRSVGLSKPRGALRITVLLDRFYMASGFLPWGGLGFLLGFLVPPFIEDPPVGAHPRVYSTPCLFGMWLLDPPARLQLCSLRRRVVSIVVCQCALAERDLYSIWSPHALRPCCAAERRVFSTGQRLLSVLLLMQAFAPLMPSCGHSSMHIVAYDCWSAYQVPGLPRCECCDCCRKFRLQLAVVPCALVRFHRSTRRLQLGCASSSSESVRPWSSSSFRGSSLSLMDSFRLRLVPVMRTAASPT